MSLLVEYFLRATLVFALAFAGTRMLRRQRPALRHVIWICAFLIAATTPVFLQFGPRIHIDRPAPAVTPQTAFVSGPAVNVDLPASPAAPRFRSIPYLEIGWIAGMLPFLIRMGSAGRKTRALLKHAAVLPNLTGVAVQDAAADSVRIAESDAVATAMTVGVFRPWILLPRERKLWEPELLRAVLLHELAHVRRRDCLVQWLPNVVCAVHWFNPLAWLARSEMLCESERACDDAVIRSGIGGSAFARDLVDIAQSLRLKGNSLMSPALTTKLERRIARLVDPAADRRPLTAARAVLGATAALVLLAPIAGVKADQVVKAPTVVSVPQVRSEGRVTTDVVAAPKKTPRMLAQVAQVPQPAQTSSTGSLSGVVSDPTGAVVVGATVRVQLSTASYSTTTGPTGQWSFAALPAGTYTLEIQLPGFATFNKAVAVTQGINNQINSNLVLGRSVESMTVAAERSTPNPATFPTAVQSSSRPLRVGGMVEPARLIRRVTPTFPQSARDRGIQGSITFAAVIDKSGFIRDTPLTVSQAPPDLIQAALDAVRQWEYAPARLNGEPVETLTEITVNFQLQ
jgi:TonB family protein